MIQRSISMPVKPRYIDEERPRLERSEEIEELFNEDELSRDSTNYLEDISSKGDQESNTSPDKQQEADFEYDTIESAEDTIDTIDNTIDDDDDDNIDDATSALEKQVQELTNTRVFGKTGNPKVTFLRIPGRSWRYCKDFVTTLVEQKWQYTFTMFVATFVISWIIFTLLWYIIAYAHGDLLFDEVTGERLGEGTEPCIIGATSLVGIFIYTVETQITIGFGEKYPSEECPESVFLFVFQIIVSIAFEGAMIGIIYAKIARPVKLITKLKFSKFAVIGRRDGRLCFCFRVCDPREQQTIQTKIYAYILMDKTTAEGEKLKKIHKELKIDGNQNPLILWPETICHIIDKKSPLYEFSLNNFKNQNFEIFISLVGTSPTTGQMTESKTSYLPCEILWGERFANIIYYDWIKGNYVIDYNNFNTTIPTDMNTTENEYNEDDYPDYL